MNDTRRIERSAFLRSVKERWPELREGINAEMGLLHLEVSHVRRHLQRAIDSGAERDVDELLAFLDHAFRNGDRKLSNAIGVSVIERLNFEDSRRHQRAWALQRLPAALREAHEALTGGER